jgi:hypothetical protein
LGIDAERSRELHAAIEAGFEGVRPGWSRVSLHYTITDETAAFLLDALAFVAENGARFVPLYRFDWSTGAWTHEADAEPACGFDSAAWEPVPRSRASASADHRRYLAEARALAETLEVPTGEPTVPDGLDPELVSFMTP